MSLTLQKDGTLAEIYQDRKLARFLDDFPDLITESLDGVDRVSKIVKNLKTFARIDNPESAQCDINESLDSALNIVWNELKYKAEIHKDFGDLPELKCDPQQISQVVLKLLINAGHAIEKQGEVHLKTWRENHQICFSIRDTGSGMSEETRQRLFEPFFITKPVGKGTGLGMSIVNDIVQQHQGPIEVESVLGEGSCFTIRLPLVVSESGAAL